MKKIEEDLEEIKLSLNSLSTDVKKVIKQQGLLTSLMDQIKELKNLITEKDKKTQLLEMRVEELEQ